MAWSTTVKGRNLKVIKLSPEEMANKYGAPNLGREAAEAEMESVNEDRMMKLPDEEGWE